jgi:hypothetical protein
VASSKRYGSRRRRTGARSVSNLVDRPRSAEGQGGLLKRESVDVAVKHSGLLCLQLIQGRVSSSSGVTRGAS